jgi:hypothetical protein
MQRWVAAKPHDASAPACPRGRSNNLGYRREPTIELHDEKTIAAVRPDAAVRLAPQHDQAVVSEQLLGFKADLGAALKRILDLKNAANSSGKDDKRDRCRQRGAILAHQFTRIRFPDTWQWRAAVVVAANRTRVPSSCARRSRWRSFINRTIEERFHRADACRPQS